MRAVTVTTLGTATSNVYVPDTYISPFNIGFGVVVTGTVTYTVQHTFDDPLASTFSPSTATWFSHEDLANATTSQDGNYAFPVRAIRVNQTAGSGSTATVFVQAGIA
jgi:hypothetical protein